MYKKNTLIVFIVLVLSALFCQAGFSEGISGKIITGYRVLELDPDAKDNSFTVYRGDYIKFRYPQKFASQPFSI